MNADLNHLLVSPFIEWTSQYLIQAGLVLFYTFTLVIIRVSGLMIIGPIFGQSIVPVNIRIFLILTMAFIITPTLYNHSQIVFHRLDQNHDRALTADEIPEHLQERFNQLVTKAGKNSSARLSIHEFFFPIKIPNSLFEYLWVIAGEFSLGLLLGVGVLTIFSGLQLAGELIDQQTGLGLADVFNPGLEISGSLTGQNFLLLTTLIFLVMEPFGGHLLVLSALVDTFQTFPIGDVYISNPSIYLLRDLLQQSFVIGIQIAGPLLATMALVALSMGFLGHTVPQINILIIGFPIRAILSLVILTWIFSGLGKKVVVILPKVIQEITNTLPLS